MAVKRLKREFDETVFREAVRRLDEDVFLPVLSEHHPDGLRSAYLPSPSRTGPGTARGLLDDWGAGRVVLGGDDDWEEP